MYLLEADAAAVAGKQPGMNAVNEQPCSAAAWTAPVLGGGQQKGLLGAVTAQH